LLHNFKYNQVVHEIVVFVSVQTLPFPFSRDEGSLSIEEKGEGFYQAILRYGFMEPADIPKALESMRECGIPLGVRSPVYFISRLTLVFIEKKQGRLARWRRDLFAFMFHNALRPAEYFRLPPNRVVELGEQICL
jgi:KUP system potassium uptake protein